MHHVVEEYSINLCKPECWDEFWLLWDGAPEYGWYGTPPTGPYVLPTAVTGGLLKVWFWVYEVVDVTGAECYQNKI